MILYFGFFELRWFLLLPPCFRPFLPLVRPEYWSGIRPMPTPWISELKTGFGGGIPYVNLGYIWTFMTIPSGDLRSVEDSTFLLSEFDPLFWLFGSAYDTIQYERVEVNAWVHTGILVNLKITLNYMKLDWAQPFPFVRYVNFVIYSFRIEVSEYRLTCKLFLEIPRGGYSYAKYEAIKGPYSVLYLENNKDKQFRNLSINENYLFPLRIWEHE